MNRAEARGDDGFTLVEMVVALLILAIVMSAFGPTFIGMMRASASTDQRSVADSLAVAASENVRALPYYEVGFSSTHGNPTYCTGSNPVQTDVVGPMDTLATQQTLQHITYTIQSCAYWVNASDTSAEAYKESVVTVLWGSSNQYKYQQTSAIYPGGESSYQQSGTGNGADNFTPTTIAGATIPPPAPVANSATLDSGDLTTIVDVDWQPVTFSYPVLYEVEYWSNVGGGVTRAAAVSAGTLQPSAIISGAPDGTTNCAGSSCLEFQISGLTPGTPYNFDVLAESGTQWSAPSNVVSATTNTAVTTTCPGNSINIAPTQPQVDSHGNPTNFTSLSVTVNAPSTCTGLSVEYGLNDKNGNPQAPLTLVPLTYSSGSFGGQATQSTWQRSTYGFVVYQNGTATTLQANVTPCKLTGNSCN
jgi:prepilin-type N-terminal cleavage/methylation domain-containing protein